MVSAPQSCMRASDNLAIQVQYSSNCSLFAHWLAEKKHFGSFKYNLMCRTLSNKARGVLLCMPVCLRFGDQSSTFFASSCRFLSKFYFNMGKSLYIYIGVIQDDCRWCSTDHADSAGRTQSSTPETRSGTEKDGRGEKGKVRIWDRKDNAWGTGRAK